MISKDEYHRLFKLGRKFEVLDYLAVAKDAPEACEEKLLLPTVAVLCIIVAPAPAWVPE